MYKYSSSQIDRSRIEIVDDGPRIGDVGVQRMVASLSSALLPVVVEDGDVGVGQSSRGEEKQREREEFDKELHFVCLNPLFPVHFKSPRKALDEN